MNIATTQTAITQLAAAASDIMTARPADHVIHAAKRCVIDWYATTLPGTTDRPAMSLQTGLSDELGQGRAWTLSGQRGAARTVALINATASHTVEFDDIFAPAIYHPGSPTIAAALAMAESRGASGLAFLQAIIAGYEISTRIGVALGRPHYRFWHNTGTVGTFGAATAAGLLAGLTSSQLAHALAIAATMAAGLQQAFRGDTQTKPLHAGHAADAGMVAVAQAAGGVKGALDMLEAPAGLGAAMSENVDWAAALADLHSQKNITRMTVKNHGCCGHIFPALDGALALQASHGFDAKDVATIEVGGYSATVDVTGNYIADSPPAAKFCLPFIVASGLVHGSIRLDAYEPARLTDPVVRSLMQRVTFHLDPEIDTLFPRQRAANVKITLTDGRQLTHFQPHRVGDPDLPLDDRQLEAKFTELASTILNNAASDALLADLWQLEKRPSMARSDGPFSNK